MSSNPIKIKTNGSGSRAAKVETCAHGTASVLLDKVGANPSEIVVGNAGLVPIRRSPYASSGLEVYFNNRWQNLDEWCTDCNISDAEMSHLIGQVDTILPAGNTGRFAFCGATVCGRIGLHRYVTRNTGEKVLRVPATRKYTADGNLSVLCLHVNREWRLGAVISSPWTEAQNAWLDESTKLVGTNTLSHFVMRPEGLTVYRTVDSGINPNTPDYGDVLTTTGYPATFEPLVEDADMEVNLHPWPTAGIEAVRTSILKDDAICEDLYAIPYDATYGSSSSLSLAYLLRAEGLSRTLGVEELFAVHNNVSPADPLSALIPLGYSQQSFIPSPEEVGEPYRPGYYYERETGTLAFIVIGTSRGYTPYLYASQNGIPCAPYGNLNTLYGDFETSLADYDIYYCDFYIESPNYYNQFYPFNPLTFRYGSTNNYDDIPLYAAFRESVAADHDKRVKVTLTISTGSNDIRAEDRPTTTITLRRSGDGYYDLYDDNTLIFANTHTESADTFEIDLTSWLEIDDRGYYVKNQTKSKTFIAVHYHPFAGAETTMLLWLGDLTISRPDTIDMSLYRYEPYTLEQ